MNNLYLFEAIKNDFPILMTSMNGVKLCYLDSGASSQKPKCVIEEEANFYLKYNANVHRGAHTLGDEATRLYEEARAMVAKFVGVKEKQIIFVRNTTEAINFVAYSYGLDNLKQGDIVLTTLMEHHANIVPWQEICKRVGAKVEYVKFIKETGEIDLDDYQNKLKMKPKIVTFTHVSNTLGTINPVKEMAKMAHKVGAKVLIDGAQAVSHMKVDATEIGCDFYAFSGHKMLGPMGIGVLCVKQEVLEQLSPFMTGGGMIESVTTSGSSWAEIPEKFEAGTPNVAGAIGLRSAVEYLDKLGMENVRAHDKDMVAYALEKLSSLENIKIYGPRDVGKRSGSIAFEYIGVHGHDVATILDSCGVAVRSGHHCSMPLHHELGVSATIRASFNVYSTKQDVLRLVEALDKVKEVFGK